MCLKHEIKNKNATEKHLIAWKIQIEICFYFFLDARQYDKTHITFVSLKKIRILTSLNAAQELFNAETIFRY